MPRRSLQRVLTDERYARGGSHGPSRAATLMRSTTSIAVPGLKREGSESSLGNIPPIETQAINASRGGVLKSKKFSQREVDLSNLVSVNEAKYRKVNIEAELKDAIATLKRPNRQLAVQELVDTAERRASSITNRSHSEFSYGLPPKLLLTFCRIEKARPEPIISGCTNYGNTKRPP
jgi:DNA replication regulator SLD3